MIKFEDENYIYEFDGFSFEVVSIDKSNREIEKLVFGRSSDYFISIYNMANYELNFEMPIDYTFYIEKDNALYSAFETFLKNMNSVTIEDDFREDKKIEIAKGINHIFVHLTNNYIGDDDYSNTSVTVKNIMYDMRSELDQKDTDIKIRLFNLFEDVNIIFQANEKGNPRILK